MTVNYSGPLGTALRKNLYLALPARASISLYIAYCFLLLLCSELFHSRFSVFAFRMQVYSVPLNCTWFDAWSVQRCIFAAGIDPFVSLVSYFIGDDYIVLTFSRYLAVAPHLCVIPNRYKSRVCFTVHCTGLYSRGLGYWGPIDFSLWMARLLINYYVGHGQ